MSTNSPKWSRKSARRGGAGRSAFAAGAALTLLAACSSGSVDVGMGLPPVQEPIAWGALQTLATNPASVTPPAAVFGANGTVSVLWSQIGMPVVGVPSTVPLVGARENTTGTTAFTAAEAIETGNFDPADTINQLKALPSAFGSMAAWRRRQAGTGDRLTSALREANGWGTLAIATPSTALFSDELSFAANDAGAQVAVWTEMQMSGERLVMVAARVGAGGWSAPTPAQFNPAATGSAPAVAVDPNGVAMIVWREQAVGGIGFIKARSYDTNSVNPLGIVLSVDNAQATDGRNPRVAALGPGNFAATWEQAALGSAAYDLRAATGTAASWLPKPDPLETGAGTVDQSRLVAGPPGTAYSVWRQNNAVFFARYAAGLWSVARQVSGSLAGASSEPRVGADGSGNAIFVWVQAPTGGAIDDLFYATFTASSGAISGAFALESETGGAASSPSLSVASNGAAVVAWLQAVAGQASPNVVARVFRP